jgi:hypothetical protein
MFSRYRSFFIGLSTACADALRAHGGAAWQ